MNTFFTYFTPFSYWILVALWITILVIYMQHLSQRELLGRSVVLLLTVLALDAFRSLVESLYFGFYFNAKFGYFSQAIYETLGQPQLIILPKLLNIVTGVVIIVILIRSWLPRQMRLSSIERQQKKERLDLMEESHAQMGMTMFGLDQYGLVRFWGRGGYALLGYQEHELVGKNLEKILVTKSWQQLSQVLSLVEKMGMTGLEGNRMIVHGVHKSGERIELALQLSIAAGMGHCQLVGVLMPERVPIERISTSVKGPVLG
ncbi:PAS domain S-box protein [Magnetococcus sp. PR-3]|uniref:PAS domain S-box protein n=1 Tax=Magnetococcus sp. PR-3 TaxID=3120355 RepID=UPI002FCE403A